MMQKIRSRRGRDFSVCAAILLALVALIYAAMCLWGQRNPCDYPYPTYLLQAQAWLRGETALDRNYEFLELAIYNGKYYVSFPPVPSIPMVLYTLIWGNNVPGGLFQKIYIAIACLLVLSELMRTGRMKRGDCIAWALFLCLGSAMLPITLVGAVWYEAQILAFLFSTAAIIAMRRRHSTLACLLYALSVGCRPFSVVLGPVLLMLYWEHPRLCWLSTRRKLARLVPGLAVGLAVAACYAAYNYARFDNIFEFGHNYLPEFVRSEHGQFSLHHVVNNWRTLFFGTPIHLEKEAIRLEQFGFSMFVSCPIFICNLVWFADDLIHHRMTKTKWCLLLMGALNVFLLLLHRTLGAYQFGMRYTLELVPLCIAWLLSSPNRCRLTRWESVLMCFGLIFNLVGGVAIAI